MPTNKELIEEIKKLDSDADTDGLTNAQLTEKLQSLKDNDDLTGGANAEDDGHTHKVADGKAITTKRGTLEGGAGISAADVGGVERLKVLVKSGHIHK